MSKAQDKIWREARRRAQRQLASMTDEEDAEIRAGIARDPDAFEITDDMWARARPAIEVMPEIVEAYRRRRGPQKAPTKELISLRLDRDVVTHFRKRGAGWQRSINDVLRRAARLSPKAARASKTARASKVTRTSGVTKSSQARQRPRRGR
jgi:uncharacterized protein (DUF4415 family)